MSTGADLVAYLGGLELVGGDHDGELLEVLPWEKRFVRGTFAQPEAAALSVARGNGKSAIVAGIAAAVVDPGGPLHGRRRDVICVAASFEQARIVYRDVLGYLRGLGHNIDRDGRTWRKQDGGNRAIIEHRPSEATVRCIGSNPSTASGLRPFVALLDEPADWAPATRDRMLTKINTALGKVPGSRTIALGTRPADAGHWFAKLLAGGAGYAQCHAARPTDPPGQLRTWRRANPSLDHLPSLLAKIRAEWRDAKRDPSLLPGFKSMRLNLGVSEVAEAVLLDAETWQGIEAESPETAHRATWGVDLGSGAAMSAVAAYDPSTGVLEALAAFPAEPGLAERGLADGVGGLYGDMHRRGELLTLGRRVVDVSALLTEALERWGPPGAVVADRWRQGDLVEALTEAEVPRARLVLRGQGFKDGGEDVRLFRRACLDGMVHPAPSLLLRSAMAEARTAADAAGNEKLAKASEGGRRRRAKDDAVAAAILAVAEGVRRSRRNGGPGRVYLGSTG